MNTPDLSRERAVMLRDLNASGPRSVFLTLIKETTLSDPVGNNDLKVFGSSLVDRLEHLVRASDGGDDFVGIGGPLEGL
jgi:hypothetical protein